MSPVIIALAKPSGDPGGSGAASSSGDTLTQMHRFALVTADDDALGVFMSARNDWQPGDIIPAGRASMRVLDVIPAAAPGNTPGVAVLKVEHVEP